MSEDLLEAVVLGMLGSAPNRARAPVTSCTLAYVREMTLDDVRGLTSPDRPRLPELTSPLTELRNKHHLLARSLASGASDIQASAETGYATSTVSTLKKSPAFVELVEYYRGNKEARLLELAERRAIVGTMVLEEIEARLEKQEVRERLSMKELRELVGTVIGEGSVAKPAAPPPGGFGGGAAQLHVTFTSATPFSPHVEHNSHLPALELTATRVEDK